MKKRFLIVMSVILVLMCTPSYAAVTGNELECEITMTKTGIEVTGRISEAADEEILLRVLSYSETPVSLERDLIYMEQQKSAQMGILLFLVYCLMEDSGERKSLFRLNIP